MSPPVSAFSFSPARRETVLSLPRMISRLRALVVLGLAAFGLIAAAAPANADYKGVIVMDAASGSVLFEDRADVVTPPASVTNLMTFLLVADRLADGSLKLETPVTVALEDAQMGGTQVWLEKGEVFTVDELLYALMIQSANDVASSLSRIVAGSREAFVAKMNERARGLGMTNTTFRTPHGLPPANRNVQQGDLTSPRDLALLSRELLLKTDILRYTSTKQHVFGAEGGKRAEPVIMRNHNGLLGKVTGVDGLKTGFTNSAGFCLASTAQRDGRRIIVVMMGSSASKSRDLQVAALIEKYFPQIPAGSIFKQSPIARAHLAPAASESPIATSPIAPGHSAAASSPVATPPAPPADEAPSIRFVLPPKKKGQ